jgi:perosamine synthetase
MPPRAKAIVDILRMVLADRTGSVALHEPVFAGQEWLYLKHCLDSGWVSSAGEFVNRFESMLAARCGVRYAVATVNGTAALHAALLIAGVQKDDEVIVPALTFVATANAVSYCGAIPHLADSDELTLGINPAKLAAHLDAVAEPRDDGCYNRRTGRRIRAIVPMHTFGHPVDMDALMPVADGHRLAVIEDATEALGSTYKGRLAGSLGQMGTLSFNGNKIITTGGGGAILTDDSEIARKAKHLTTTAKKEHRWALEHDSVGYNYRLPNLNAALGCAQLEQLDGFIAAKRDLARRYSGAFSALPGVRFFQEPEFAQSNYWLNAILVEPGQDSARDDILDAANSAGFMLRPAWTLMHQLPMYAHCPRSDLSVAEKLERCIINLPSSASLGNASGSR